MLEKNVIQYFDYGNIRIPFIVHSRDRKDLSISVNPDMTVTVLAPENVSFEKVMESVRRRRQWILKQRTYFEEFHPLPPEKRFVSGETHCYLGRQYRLKIKEDKNCGVKLAGRFLNVTVPDKADTGKVKETLGKWFHAHAKIIFRKKLEFCLGSAKSLRILNLPVLRVRIMSKRWGSCSRSGTITLNQELVKTPLSCIEYVIMHELCHIRIPRHKNEFYLLLSRLMPDWKKRKEKLDRIVI